MEGHDPHRRALPGAGFSAAGGDSAPGSLNARQQAERLGATRGNRSSALYEACVLPPRALAVRLN